MTPDDLTRALANAKAELVTVYAKLAEKDHENDRLESVIEWQAGQLEKHENRIALLTEHRRRSNLAEGAVN